MTPARVLPGALIGAAAGLGVAAIAGAGVSAWRGPVVGAAAGLLVGGLRRLAGLARLEWRREAPPARAYLAALAPVLAALVLAGVATA